MAGSAQLIRTVDAVVAAAAFEIRYHDAVAVVAGVALDVALRGQELLAALLDPLRDRRAGLLASSTGVRSR